MPATENMTEIHVEFANLEFGTELSVTNSTFHASVMPMIILICNIGFFNGLFATNTQINIQVPQFHLIYKRAHVLIFKFAQRYQDGEKLFAGRGIVVYTFLYI